MDFAFTVLYYIFMALYIYTALVIITVIMLENRNPVKTLAWILLMIALPVVGIIIYMFVGQDFRRKKIFTKQKRIRKRTPRNRQSFDMEQLPESNIPPHMQKVVRLLNSNSEAPIFNGNRINVYTTGQSTFDALFHDIEEAKEHIHIEFYIIADDSVGNRLRDLLILKALEGVEVRVIYDYLGGWTLKPLWKKDLVNAGVEIQPFSPAKTLFGFSRVNYRNHRKIVVIDGKIGYTGGLNIADRYLNGNELGLWRDTFIRIEGPAVHDMQYHFLNDWYFVNNEFISAEQYYPPIEHYDKCFIQSVTSGPDTDWENIMQGIICAIQGAQHSIFIHTPYCIPPEGVLSALQIAALSGIDVRLMVPVNNDARLVAAAGRSYFEVLMKAGVKIYHYERNFLHSKAIVIDNYLSVIGTANMDIRSYEQNFEIASFIYDKETASILIQHFEDDMKSSHLIHPNLWRHRPRLTRYAESLARLCSPLL